ncbi:hypothetical protein ACFTZ8_00200 [Streptomyces fungicidicus]|uniref:hypothetical protein n=1 Tax=Streptomyces fungicidicus TaxID=68203 RepID=UPI0036354065
MRKALTNGCLVVLMIPAVLLAYFWYSVWQAGHENDRRRQEAHDSLLRQARAAADRTVGALDESAAGGNGGADVLTGVIWEHTSTPVISYDEERRAFTAVGLRSAEYTEEMQLLGGGPDMVQRCFVSSYVRRPGAGWTSKVTERDIEACRGSRQIESSVRFVRTAMEGWEADGRFTRAGLQRVLDPVGRAGDDSRFVVRSVVRRGESVVAVVLFRDTGLGGGSGSEGAVVEQCYRLQRVLGSGGGVVEPVTAVPVVVC